VGGELGECRLMNAVWGEDDCLTRVVGDDFVGDNRPLWLRTATAEQALDVFAKRYDGDLRAGVVSFVRQFAPGYRNIVSVDDRLPRDVVVGRDECRSFVIAVVGVDHMMYERTESGLGVVSFVELYSVWRRDDNG